MPVVRPNVRSFATLSMGFSVVSVALSLFFYVGASKPFIILTSAVPISMIAGFIATAAIAYQSLKSRSVSVRCFGAFALAIAAYAFGNFVIRDYAGG
ncbi:MAG: hypothetical protein QNJ14_18820 [Woeseiaceae bacterium]|nr:hypothetical protein [Woeseiaceae bacterium]